MTEITTVKSEERKEKTAPEVFYFLTMGFSILAFFGNIPLKVSILFFFIYFFVLVFDEKIETKNILSNSLILSAFIFFCESSLVCYFFFPVFYIFLFFILVARSIW